MEKILGRLPGGARSVVELYGLYCYSHEEAADMLGIEVGTCKAQLHRAGTAGVQSAADIAADLVLKSISGILKLRGKNSRLRTTVSTVSGSISLVNVGGELDLDTVSGDVDIDMNTVTRARIEDDFRRCRHGRPSQCRLAYRPVQRERQSAYPWPGAEKANVDVESFSGNITACFGNVEVQWPKYGPGSSWRYGVSDATSDIHIKTMSGDLNVCNR